MKSLWWFGGALIWIGAIYWLTRADWPDRLMLWWVKKRSKKSPVFCDRCRWFIENQCTNSKSDYYGWNFEGWKMTNWCEEGEEAT